MGTATETPRLNAVDMSKYGGAFTPTEAECMREAGVRLVIPGTGHANSLGKWSEQHAKTALDAGMVIDAYRWLNLSETIGPQMVNAFESMGEHLDDVRMWWIDAEDTTLGDMGPEQVVQAIQKAVDFCEQSGVRHGIYTGQWWWKPKTGNSKQFAYLPLWNAYYDGDPDEDGLPYGGWEHSAIEQYKGTTDLCGQSVDLNYAKNLLPLPEDPDPGDAGELVLLMASVLAGRSDGVPFATIGEALETFRALELRDIRVLQGLGDTQGDLAAHLDDGITLGGAHSE